MEKKANPKVMFPEQIYIYRAEASDGEEFFVPEEKWTDIPEDTLFAVYDFGGIRKQLVEKKMISWEPPDEDS